MLSTHAPLGLYLLFSLLQTAVTPTFHSLTVQTIAWILLSAVAFLLSRRHQKLNRFAASDLESSSVKETSGSVELAGCILAASVCARAAGAVNWAGNLWIQALVPAAYFLFRPARTSHTLSAPNLAVVAAATVSALLALSHATHIPDRSTLIFCLLSAGFTGAAYKKLDEQIGEQVVVGQILKLGKGVARWLVPGHLISAVLLESLLGARFGWQRNSVEALMMRETGWAMVLTGGVLAAFKWGLVPVVIGKWTGGGLGLIDAVGVILAGAMVPSDLHPMRVLGVLGACVSVSYWLITSTTSPAQTASKPKSVLALCVLAGPILVSALYITISYMSTAQPLPHRVPSPVSAPAAPLPPSPHPIPTLIRDAEDRFNALLKRQSKTLDQAVAEYKRRYGLPPPPHFDKWFSYATNHNLPIIDDYDTIHHSLRPFWALPPATIRRMVRQAMGFKEDPGTGTNRFVHVYIRDGRVTTTGQGPDWQKEATAGMIERFAEWLPDLDLPFNIHDEPRVAVPHDLLSTLLQLAGKKTEKMQGNKLTDAFTPRPEEEKGLPEEFQVTDFNSFAHQRMWTHATASCPPDAPARAPFEPMADNTTSFTTSPLGFISNTTAASDVCLSPSLGERHGFFDRPNSISLTQRLYPVFSQSKVSSFNDILYPSPWYWDDKVTYNEIADLAWEAKKPELYWRGSTTGGFSRNGGWKRQHRQRVVGVLEDLSSPAKFLEPAVPETVPATYDVVEKPREVMKDVYNVHFSHIGQCDGADCDAQKRHFHVTKPEPLDTAYDYKFLLDVDGNAFSGRYHAFLRSRSTVFKIAVFREWSDDWLIPWVHYVPLSLDMSEADEVVRWFVENDGVAKRVGENGRRWAERSLTKGAMEAWFFRLLLEYARLIDDKREMIGYE